MENKINHNLAWQDIAEIVVGAAVLAFPVAVTEEVWKSPGVEGMAEDLGLEETKDVVELRGIADPIVVHRLA